MRVSSSAVDSVMFSSPSMYSTYWKRGRTSHRPSGRPARPLRRIVGVVGVVRGVVVRANCVHRVPRGDVLQRREIVNPLPIEIPLRNGNQRDGIPLVGRHRVHFPRLAQQWQCGMTLNKLMSSSTVAVPWNVLISFGWMKNDSKGWPVSSWTILPRCPRRRRTS